MLFKTIISFFIFVQLTNQLQAQLGETFDIERPEKYSERIVGYEKTYTKKFSLPRKFIQNNISHYNFYYNANEKLKTILITAKQAQKDAYDQLLPFYSYSLEQTKSQKQELDSVIQKATGGILLHDLRTNWVDNFYLLIGKAYLLQQKFDSAEMSFNYLNYEFAPKDKDKERILTGTINTEDEDGFSIATKEKKSLTSKIFSRPSSRNESFLWLIRTHIENEDFGSASGLINTLQNDKKFPKRLHNDLDDITAFFYYKQQVYDSAAHYLAKSMDIANGKAEKARRNFLAAQLYALTNNNEAATKYYAKSVKYTLDPVMEVYGRLYSIQLNKGTDPKVIENNIAALQKMAKKDAYQDYRDIIYFFIGKMELERNNKDIAISNFIKSAKNSTNNITQKNKTYFTLADLAYTDKQYKNASNYYDSLSLADVAATAIDSINTKKALLKKLITYTENVYIEDSLQLIAAMQPNDRDEYLKKLIKRLRKEQGIKDEGTSFGSTSSASTNTNLFEPNSGEWYFYNNTAKSRGLTEFKQKWGNRPNVDNWRRQQAITSANNAATPRQRGGGRDATAIQDTSAANSKKIPKELTIEALEANLPFTDDQVKSSNFIIEEALYNLGNLYLFELEDIQNAITTYEDYLRRFKNSDNLQKVYYNLYLAYTKLGNDAKATEYKNKVTEIPSEAKKSKKTDLNEALIIASTKSYEEIYNLFLNGNYEAALSKKKNADTLYGVTSWTPQLLYLEATYYAQQRKDSLALNIIDQIINQHYDSPVKANADALRNVLLRRVMIEADLDQLKVTRVVDTVATVTTTKNVVQNNNTTNPKPINPNPIVNKTDSVKNNNTLVVKNTTAKDSIKIAATAEVKYPYNWEEQKEHYVGIVLNNVENSFVNELKNALIVYNRTMGRTLFIDLSIINNETKVLLLHRFLNATDALNYVTSTKVKAPTEIMPWLAKEKYSFIIITKENLEKVVNEKDISKYKQYLNIQQPGKF
jgi:tetratricopeptide (TPR) repeat protein